MSKRCVFVAMSSQKGGVGKSTMTVLLAGYFHYVMGYNVAVVDCDYPQFSIKALRSRDTQNVEKNVNLQRMLCGQFDRTGKKAYPVLTSVPGKELKTALPLTGGCDILFFDLPGTVNSPGVIKTIVNMDYVFTPIIQDRMVMQSSLSFLLALKDFIQQNPDMPLKEIRMFWNRMDGRVSKRLSYQYGLLFKELGLKALDTVIPGKGREGVCIHTRWQDRKADRFPQARCPVRDLPCGKDEDISCRLSQPQGVRPPQADLYQL